MATKKQEVKQEVKQELVVPEYMKKFAMQSQIDTESIESASISIPRLTYRGKRFRFVENGEEEIVKELTVKVVILGVEPGAGRFSKVFYDVDYTSGDKTPPTCSSSDGLKPDSWVSGPQAKYCANCPQNVFGSATSRSGGKSKACKDNKVLWVARLNDLEKFYGLKVPVMSLKNLAEFGKFIRKNNYPLSLVVTEIGFEEEAEYPQLTFKHVGFVDEKNSEVTIKMNTQRPWLTYANVEFSGDPIRNEPIGLPEPDKTATVKNEQISLEDVIKQW